MGQKKKSSLRGRMILFNSLITLTALVFCGLVLVIFVWFTMAKSARHDLEFFLTQTNENLKIKTEYLEQVVYDLRESDVLMNHLKGEQYGLTQEGMQELFAKSVDISNRKNAAKGSLPMVEQVYLFAGEFVYCTSYYAMIKTQQKEQDDKVYAGYQSYLLKGERYEYQILPDGSMLLFYPLYEEEMNAVGTLAFVMKQDTFLCLMEDIDNYQESFFLLYDSSGQILAERYSEKMSAEVLVATDRIQNKVLQEELGKETYLLEDASLSMNLNSCIGISKKQTFFGLYESIKLYTALIFVITFGAVVLFVLIIYRLTKPLKEFSFKLEQVRQGEFETKLPDYDTKEFYEIGTAFNEMTAYVNQLIHQVYEKQISMKEMELKFYQTQMNPHFMFNVLNTIALQAKMDKNEEVFQMISSFSRLIQAKIYREDKEKVKISQELTYVKYYLYLQKNRFGERLDYKIDLKEEEIGECFIPKLCIQLIAENAVVHGIEPKIGAGMVTVEIKKNGGDICIDTIDNGVGFDTEGEITLPIEREIDQTNHNQVGLNNADKILKLSYGESYGIRVFSKKGEGSRVSIRIPIDREEGEHVPNNACR